MNRATWEHNSEPIEPAAPVIRMERPAMLSRIGASSNWTGCRPSRSVTDKLRTCELSTLPLSNSSSPGIVLQGTLAARQLDNTSCIWRPVADGMAMMISRISICRLFRRPMTKAASRPEPNTGTPMIRPFRLRGSSSKKPFTSYLTKRLDRISRNNSVPAAPAP